MRFVKRTLSAFLALVMVFTMLPLQVWASETQQSANDSVNFSSIVADGAGDDRALEPDGNDVDTYIFKIDDKVVSTQYVKNGEVVYEPEAPAKEGYKFVGWFEGEAQFVAGPASNVQGMQHTYTARYQQVYYVFFMDGIDDNAAVVHTQEGVTGTVIDTAFTFNAGPDSGVEGWYYDRKLTQKVQPDETIQDQNITLYPKVEQGHWLRFDSNGGTPVASQFVLPSDKTTEPAAPTREGYDFDGWYNGDAKFEFNKPLNESATLTAQWQGKQVKYKVFYWVENADDDGYSLVNSVEKTGTAGDPSVNPGDTLELPRDYPDKNLANAVHYNAEKTGNEAEKTIAGDGSTIVNVYYDRNEYTLYFYQQGGGRGELICAKREHTHDLGCYIFGCEKEEHTHTAACYKQSSGNYAADPITGKYGASLAKMGAKWPSNTVNGRNWSTKADGSAPYQANIETIPAKNTSFWVPDRPGWSSYDQTAYYYVEVLGNEKTDTYVGSKYYKMYDEVTVKSGSLTVSAEDRYEIQGFTLNKSDSTAVRDKYDNARFYYTRNNYTLTLVNGGSQEVKSLQYEAPLRPHLGEPAKPSGMGENFTFQGWYRDENFNEKFEYNDKTTMPANSLTLYAKWAAPEITVTVHTGTGTDSGTQKIKVPYGGKIDPQDLPNIMLPDGIDTYNWATYRDGKYLSFDLDTPLYQDVTIYPYWVSNERFSVTYVLGENVQGEVIDSKRYWGNADADIQGLPKGFKHPEGKVFLGWESDREGDKNLYQPGDKIQIQNADVILKAKWGNQAVKTTLTYRANDGTDTEESFDYYNNEKVELKTADELNFKRNGFEFLGWATNEDATAAQYQADQTIRVNNDDPTGNILYAVWNRISLPGTAITVQVLMDGQRVNASEYATIRGHEGTENFNFEVDGDNYRITYTYMNLNCADFYVVLNEIPAGYTATVDSDLRNTIGQNGEERLFSKSGDPGNWFLDNVPGGATVTVRLTKQEFTVKYEASPAEGGTVNPTSETVHYGENAQGSTATPNEGYYFVEWLNEKYEQVSTEAAFTPDGVVTENATYTAVFAKKENIEVTITGNHTEGTYNGVKYTAKGYTVTVPEGSSYTENDIVFSGNDTVFRTDAGTTKMGLKASQFTNKNEKYNVTFKVVDGYVKVEPAEVKVTAENKTKVYGGNDPELTATVTGTIGDDTVAYTLSRVAGENVDNYTITPKGEEVQGNYKVVYKTGTLTITKASGLTFTASGYSGVYDGEEHFATATSAVPGTTFQYKVGEGEWQNEAPSIKDVGSKSVTVKAINSNYDEAETQTVELEVTPKAVTVTAENKTKVYGENDPELTATVADTIGTDTVTYTLSRVSGEDAGTYTITPEGEEVQGNYKVAYETGTLTINKRQVALESESGEQVYNGKALTKPDVKIGDVKFVEGDAEVEAIGTQTLVGESDNTIKITWKDDALAGNYNITKTEGKLIVTPPENLDEYVVKEHNGVDQNFKVGDTVTFKISVTNIYDVKAAVTLEEMAGMTFGNGQTTLEDVLDPGQTKTYTATRILTEQDFENGGVRNTVKVTLVPDGKDPIEGGDDDDVKLEEKPDMSVDKTVVNPQDSYRVGDTIRYQITVTNTGNVPLHDLELTDVMNADGKVTFPAGTALTRELLNIGETWTVTCSYVVRDADEGKTISNTAKVISRDDDGNSNKDGEDTTPGESVQKRYSLTIHYRNAAGNAVAGSYSARYHVGDSFKVVSPIVAGYYDPQIRSISSGANGMPAQDLEYVVTYTAIPAPVDPDPDGPNPGPDDGDDDDDTPPAPVEPEEPGDYEVDPDDYTLTEVEDNETPLANLNLEGHTCCILHLLLMLAAMVVLGFDTKSRKKHQARIFELKKMLAMEEDHSDDPEQP